MYRHQQSAASSSTVTPLWIVHIAQVIYFNLKRVASFTFSPLVFLVFFLLALSFFLWFGFGMSLIRVKQRQSVMVSFFINTRSLSLNLVRMPFKRLKQNSPLKISVKYHLSCSLFQHFNKKKTTEKEFQTQYFKHTSFHRS